jgi:hypothetical protein
MVIYTCILRKGSSKYECYEGFREFPNLLLEDYRNISIPPSERKFRIFRKFEETQKVKLFFHPKFQRNILYPEITLLHSEDFC